MFAPSQTTRLAPLARPWSRSTPSVFGVGLISILAWLLVMASVLGLALCAANAAAGSVTEATLKAKIQALEGADGIDAEAKTDLLELYRKAVTNLQVAAANVQAAQGFQRAGQGAPAEVERLRAAIDNAAAAPPEASLELDSDVPLSQLEPMLQKEKADLAAVDARRADFERRLEEEAGRPALIRQRLTEAKQEQEEVAAQLKLPPPADQEPAMAEARGWVLDTRFDLLSGEIKLLDQELLSQPMRVDLLKAKRDKADASVDWVGARVRLLQELVNRGRQAEAEQARAEAAATRREAEGKHPLVVELAGRNATLSEELASMAARQAELAQQADRTERLARQVEADFKRAQETIAVGGLSQRLGQMLQQQRRSMPDRRDYRQAVSRRSEQTAEIGLRRLEHREEAKSLRLMDEYLSGMLEAAPDLAPELRGELRELAGDRKGLLEKAIAADEVFLRKLGELESAQARLLDAIAAYDAFLDEHLLWVRSAPVYQVGVLGASSGQVWRVLSAEGWRQVVQTLAYQARHSPVYLLLGLVLAVLLWRRRPLLENIRALRSSIGKATSDHFGYTLLALARTLVAAAPWPLVLAITGWQLRVSTLATDFTSALGAALLAVALQLFYLRTFRLACIPGGLAAAHFRWPEANLKQLRRELDRLTRIFLPAAFVAVASARLDPLDAGWLIGRVGFLIAMGTLAFSLYRLLHPQRGVLAEYMRPRGRRTFKRLHQVWYPLVAIMPLALGVLSLLGYLYTAGTFTWLFLDTLWFALELVLVSELAKRWLLVARRRLAYEAALERQQALDEPQTGSGEEGSPFEVDEPEVDLVALSDKSRKLLTSAILFYGLLGFWVIWSDVFPALRILDQITVWQHTVNVDGEPQLMPVTLASLGLALVYAVITVVLAKQLPAVLEIALLHYSEMSAGGRYTFTTLTNYAIVSIGLVLVFKTIGTDWSQLQWLVAALGVGIGFGLQEIVANFISGIIILFERPVRIGDVITVGDTDGVVTRIRSRATTIRNWDGKELLVPNKEFITGRLLNWSLSDQTTRIILSVGIAYGSNVRQAMQLLEQAAAENETVLDEPPPSVIFESFGDNSLVMLLRCFVDSADLRFPTISALNEAINDKFNAAGIVIAFPQRDVHLDTNQPLQVELRRPRDGAAGSDVAENVNPGKSS